MEAGEEAGIRIFEVMQALYAKVQPKRTRPKAPTCWFPRKATAFVGVTLTLPSPNDPFQKVQQRSP